MNWQALDWTYLAAAGGLVLIVVAVGAWRLLQRAKRPVEQALPDLLLDVSQFDSSGPPASGPRIEFYGTAVRLAVVVIAPGGRGGELPSSDLLPGLMERLIPGMTQVIAAHHPKICRWPEQLSSHGFAHSFFNHVTLPGSRGKGTPWCSIAGKLTVGERTFLIGLVLCASAANALGQVVVQHEGQWLDILRIRNE